MLRIHLQQAAYSSPYHFTPYLCTSKTIQSPQYTPIKFTLSSWSLIFLMYPSHMVYFILWVMNFHSNIHEILCWFGTKMNLITPQKPDTVPSKDKTHIPIILFTKLHFNIISPSLSLFPKWSLLIRISKQNAVSIFYFPIHATCSCQLNLFIWPP